MGYYINFSEISLKDFRDRLMRVNLVPSRILLRDNINLRFAEIAAQGINNIAELSETVNTPKKLQNFATAGGIDENYLKILKREINSMLAKPNKIKNFPNLAADTVKTLEKLGIKNTRQLYDQIISAEERRRFTSETGLSPDIILELAKLTDLSRIQWVNHTFASMLYELGYETAKQIASANVEKMFIDVNDLNREKGTYHHGFGIADIQRCIDAAGEIPFDIEY